VKNQHLQHIVELNLAVLLISTSGVLGRYISTPPPITIWWRCLFALVCIAVFIRYQKIGLKIRSGKDLGVILLGGVCFGAHWVTYFYALKLSNVAIGMLAVFTYPIITVLLEPLFFKTRISITHLLLGGLVLIGIYFLSPEMSLENTQVKGLIFGIISAFFYAVRNILMKKKVATYHGSLLMFYQMLVVIALLWPAFFFFEASPSGNDWLALGTLALLTTAVGHTLFVMSFKHFSIGTASIMSSIQPVYGIVFGILLLDEVPDLKTMVGGSLILLSVLVESIQSNRPQK